MNLTTHKKIIIVGILAFILGAGITKLSYSFVRHGYRDDMRGDQKMMMKKNMHRMADGSMMSNDANMDMSMDGMMQGMVANMKGKTGKELEKAFLTDMIPHHQGAVEMAKLLVADSTTSAELRAFAQAIITAQESEIEKMNVWIKGY